jgi:hypothetical protein
MNDYDETVDYCGEYDDVDLEACDEILGPTEFGDSEDFWDEDVDEEDLP